MHNQFKTQKFKHLMLAMGPRDLNSAPYSPVHCCSHSMTSFQSSELTEVPVVENSQLFEQRAHSARYAPYCQGRICAAPALTTSSLKHASLCKGASLGVRMCGRVLRRSLEMWLLSWQLAASIDFSPLTKVHQSRCVGPPLRFLHRRRVVPPTRQRDPHGNTFERRAFGRVPRSSTGAPTAVRYVGGACLRIMSC